MTGYRVLPGTPGIKAPRREPLLVETRVSTYKGTPGGGLLYAPRAFKGPRGNTLLGNQWPPW